MREEQIADYKPRIQHPEAQEEDHKTEIERNNNVEEENNNLKAQQRKTEWIREKKLKKLAKAEQDIKDEKKTVQDTL